MPVRRVIILVFVFSGLLRRGRLDPLLRRGSAGGRPTIGAGDALLDIIGATVIGGTSLAGGKGKVTWTFVGVVFFVLLSNTLNYMGLSAFHIDVVKGGIILAAAALDVVRTRLLARERAHERRDPRARRASSKAFFGVHAVRDVSSRSGAGACSAWSARTAPASRR